MFVKVSATRWETVDAAFYTREPLNVKRTRQSTARYPPRSKLPWIRELLLEAQSSDLMVSILKKSQKRNKRAGGSEQVIRLVLIIVWAIVTVVLGFYGGLHLSHHH